VSSDADADADTVADADAAAAGSHPESSNGYVHTPGEAGATTSTGSEPTGAGSSGSDTGGSAGTDPAPSETDEFGLAGWLLTGMLAVCMLIIPGVIYLYPYVLGSLGLSFFGTYLVLPLIPAAVLGVVAVWSMTAATHDE